MERVRYVMISNESSAIAEGFAIPTEIRMRVATGASMPTMPVQQPVNQAEKVAAGVYVVNDLDGFTVMFAEFKDFVMALEAPAQAYVEWAQLPVELPASTATSDSLIAVIGRSVPNKPIRYVAVSHYHNDHAGGVPAFLSRGATLLTTPGTHSYFERLARRASSGATRLETIDDVRSFTDGEQTVELINVGANPHTREALVAYFPKEKLLYQGDQFYYEGAGMPAPGERLSVMQHFVGWLERTNRPVDRIFGTHILGAAPAEYIAEVKRTARPQSF
jgi:glyoxylase-like metal-dependent hydrolase (beta-lactamase superfamily II)